MVSSILVLVIVTAFFVGVSAQRPYKQAKLEAFELAKQKGDIQTPNHFYWYNGEETYFSVTGTSSNQEELVVFIQQDTGKVFVYPGAGMITKEEAISRVVEDKRPEKILEARMGLLNNEPIWEVSYKQQNGRLGYYVLSMETGQWISNIENI